MNRKNYVILLAFLFVVLIGYSLKRDGSFFIVEETPFEISIPADHLVVAASLKPQLSKWTKSLLKDNIWSDSFHEVQSKMREHHWIQNVFVRRQLPNKIFFEAQIEEAIFIFVGKGGRPRPIVRSGKVLPELSLSQIPSRPVVRDSRILNNTVFRKKLIKNFLAIPNQGILSWNNIAQVSWQDVEGLTLDLVREGTKIHLGHKKIKTKGLQVLRVGQYLESKKIKGRVIDASFSKKVVVRPRKRS